MSPGTATVALLMLAVGAPVPPVRPHLPPPVTGKRGVGTVTALGPDGVYLDRGGLDGLAVGQPVSLTRKGRPVADCTVRALAERTALCVGAQPAARSAFRVGDAFRAVAPEAPEVKPLPEVLEPEELAGRRRVLEGTPVPLVEDRASGVVLRPARWQLLARLSHTSWSSAAGPTFHLEAVDVSLRGLELLPGLVLALDAGVRWFSGRPAVFRDPVTGPATLLVREAGLTWSDRGGLFSLAGGRVWAANVPGLAQLDGVQAGWRPRAGLELGVFAGLVPEAYTLGISGHRWTVGAWQGFEWRGDGAVRLVRQQARLGLVALPQRRGELELAAQLWAASSLALEGAARLSVGEGAPAGLDSARLSGSFRPLRRALVRVSARYVGLMPADVRVLTAPASGAPGLHGELAGAWQLFERLVIALEGGLVRDFDAALSRFWLGPQVSFPGLFAGKGGAAIGWREETGHWGRRSFFVSADGRVDRARLAARVSLTQDTPTMGSGAFSTTEVGVFFGADVSLPLGLALRGSLLVRQGLGRGFLGGSEALRDGGATAWLGSVALCGGW